MQAGVTTQAFPLGICVFMLIVGREEEGRCRENDSQQASCVGQVYLRLESIITKQLRGSIINGETHFNSPD